MGVGYCTCHLPSSRWLQQQQMHPLAQPADGPIHLCERAEARVGCQHGSARGLRVSSAAARRMLSSGRQLIRDEPQVIHLCIPPLRGAYSAGIQHGQAAAGGTGRGSSSMVDWGAGPAMAATALRLALHRHPSPHRHLTRAMHWYRAALGVAAVTGLSDSRASVRAGKASSASTAAQEASQLPPSSRQRSAAKPAKSAGACRDGVEVTSAGRHTQPQAPAAAPSSRGSNTTGRSRATAPPTSRVRHSFQLVATEQQGAQARQAAQRHHLSPAGQRVVIQVKQLQPRESCHQQLLSAWRRTLCRSAAASAAAALGRQPQRGHAIAAEAELPEIWQLLRSCHHLWPAHGAAVERKDAKAGQGGGAGGGRREAGQRQAVAAQVEGAQAGQRRRQLSHKAPAGKQVVGEV